MGLVAGMCLSCRRRVSLTSCPLVLVNRRVAIILEELGLSYESIYLTFEKGEHKAPAYLKINPNGRIPALVDHKNDNFVIWWELAS
jgi:glutathione S-transferase